MLLCGYGVDERLEESKAIIAKYPDRAPVSLSNSCL